MFKFTVLMNLLPFYQRFKAGLITTLSISGLFAGSSRTIDAISSRISGLIDSSCQREFPAFAWMYAIYSYALMLAVLIPSGISNIYY